MSILRRLAAWLDTLGPERITRAQVEALAHIQGPASSAAAALQAAEDMQQPVFYMTPDGIGVYDIAQEGPKQ